MQNLIDAHAHTLLSGHAYSTLFEMAQAAKAKGLTHLAITEHGPTMPGSCDALYFSNYKTVERNYFDINLLLGCEVNINDSQGTLDLPERLLSRQDICLAALHGPTFFDESGIQACTSAVVKALRSPYINVLAHPDDSQFPLDYDTVVAACKEYNVMIELNNASFSDWSFRVNARENATIFLDLCKKYQVPVILNSDAHFESKVGRIDYVLEFARQMNLPDNLIVNDKPQMFLDIINARRKNWGEPLSFK
ncbi:MAG: phosphatase [Fastidiosipilaceae bacterium]|jgi:putative hydrolase